MSKVDPVDLWRVALTEWDSVTEPDLHQWFGIDMDERAAWSRSWGSLLRRILGLLDIGESRLTRRMRALHDTRADGEPGEAAAG